MRAWLRGTMRTIFPNWNNRTVFSSTTDRSSVLFSNFSQNFSLFVSARPPASCVFSKLSTNPFEIVARVWFPLFDLIKRDARLGSSQFSFWWKKLYVLASSSKSNSTINWQELLLSNVKIQIFTFHLNILLRHYLLSLF